ncbi:MAG: hypothetical protein H0X67_23105 [Acidobacteria bacterium]|nr:hypothetical protein [Acidobacteriota bacterium]
MNGGQPRLWDFEPAQFRWFDHAETVSLRNESPVAVELVEIEIFSRLTCRPASR